MIANSNYVRTPQWLTAIIILCIMIAVPTTLAVSFLLAQEFGQASVKACCCIEESHNE